MQLKLPHSQRSDPKRGAAQEEARRAKHKLGPADWREPTRDNFCTAMETPHGTAPAGTALSQAPEPWWKDKAGVQDRIGKALLISQPTGENARRVVGLYQARASEADPQRVALKVAAAKRDGASFTKVDLVEALDPDKWRLIPHFVGATYEAGGDTAKVVDTLETSSNITGVVAVLTMAGQPPAEPA